MLLDVLRFVRGFVEFRVSGRFPERFLNITARRGIRVWNVRRTGGGFLACMYMSDYRAIRQCARGAGVCLHVCRRRGLPVLVRRYRDRTGLLIGGCAFVAAVFVMSLFIWSVDITGLDAVSESEMRSLLRDHGLYVGAFKPGLDFQGVAREVMLDKHEVGWMAVNVEGSYASVEIKEEAPAPEVEDISHPCNIKASADGTILRVDASSGRSVVKPGSGVVKGQVIVSGVLDDALGGQRLVHASAVVLAQTKRKVTFTLPVTLRLLRPDGDSARRASIGFLGLSLPVGTGSVSSPYAVSAVTDQALTLLDTRLPVSLRREVLSAVSEQDITLDDNSAKELLNKQADLYQLFSLSSCKVTDRTADLRREGDRYLLDVVYTCEEDIAYPDPIAVGE